ncbi:MAG: hypothetical protein NTY48_07160, partial [Candidatus Diapherotrites archaeon]|nr:hypothetical protein [Candidatus Diapherotrites archaeon]
FYSTDFAIDSLKILTYVSVFRDGRAISALDKVEAKSAEFDYLLALIKEDYAKSPTNVDALSLNTRKAIANTLHSVLLPFDTSLDYVFFIEKEGYKPGEGSFLTMIIATKKCYSNCNPQDPPENRVIKRVYFSCNPSKSNVLEKLVFPNAGKVDSAIGKIMLSKDTSGHATNYVLALHMWVSKKIGAISEIVRTSDLPLDQHEPDFRCELLSEFG